MRTLTTLLVLALPASGQAGLPAELTARLAALEGRVTRIERATWSAGPAVLCLDVGADFTPLHPTRAFPEGTRELSVVIPAGAAARFHELCAIFVAVDVGAAAPPESEMARALQPAERERPARFRYHQDGPLPVGTYRVELLGDGAPWQTLRYVVRAQSPVRAAFPLTAAHTWRYDFVQQAAPGARLVDGDAPVGERLSGTVEIRVAQASGEDAHIEIRRDGALVAQERWRWEEGGLVATARTVEGAELALEPPQPLWSSAGVCAWEYANELFGAPQHGRQWGPLALAGPWGSAQGFVVRTEQAEGTLLHVAEREFVPGLGLVRECITSARGGALIARQELVLRAKPGE